MAKFLLSLLLSASEDDDDTADEENEECWEEAEEEEEEKEEEGNDDKGASTSTNILSKKTISFFFPFLPTRSTLANPPPALSSRNRNSTSLACLLNRFRASCRFPSLSGTFPNTVAPGMHGCGKTGGEAEFLLEHPWMVDMKSKKVNMEHFLKQVWDWKD